jgi:hypothetical protein
MGNAIERNALTSAAPFLKDIKLLPSGKHHIESKQQKAARQKVGKHQPIGPMALW